MRKKIKNYDNYYIYDNGDVFNIKTKKMLDGSIGKNGYKYYRLSKENTKKMFYAHRLVAEYFIDNFDNLPVVNHKDGNKLNNNVDNLEWVSYSENMEHFHSTIKKNSKNKKIQKYNGDLEGEIWIETINNSNYKVSNYGRVWNITNNNILSPSETSGYHKVRLSKNGETSDWLVHKLVFCSFNNEINIDKNFVIDHIDGNKHNNCLNNLRKISISDNVQKAYYEQKLNSNIKPVSQYDLDNNFIATYPSSREAGRQLGLDSSSIIKCCKGKLKTTGNFIFHYA
jgi:hypothetical protein